MSYVAIPYLANCSFVTIGGFPWGTWPHTVYNFHKGIGFLPYKLTLLSLCGPQSRVLSYALFVRSYMEIPTTITMPINII